jgi:putative membrane protein
MKHRGFVFFVLLIVLAGSCRNRTETESATTTSPDTAATAAATTAPDSAATSTVPPADLNFATVASMANLYEIESGRLAEQKATGAAYKEFARTMVRQHTEIGDSYKPIAEKQGLPAPTALDDISAEANFKTLYDQLTAAQAGAAFDALYRQQMIATHTAAQSLFQTESASGQDPELKAFAAKWLPTVEHHLQMANDLPQAR